jgi:CBS domain containing-hemolysin-like protein
MIYGFAILVLWTISFFFAGIEAGLLSVDPVRLRSQVKQGSLAAMRLDRLTKSPERLLVTVLLVTNFANILGLLLATRLLVSQFAPRLCLGHGDCAPIYLFVLSVLPKSLFRRFLPGPRPLGGVLEASRSCFGPCSKLANASAILLPPPRRIGSPLYRARRTETDRRPKRARRFPHLDERAMIHNVVDFRHAGRRADLAGKGQHGPDTSIDESLRFSATHNVERLPVISPEGEAIGLVNTLDILFDENRRESLATYMRRIVIARDAEPASRIIQRLRAARLGLAAVIDSQRKLIGIVTVEDAIKRLVQSV